MNWFAPSSGAGAAAAASTTQILTKAILLTGISTVVFFVALTVGLGVGFGLSFRNTASNPSILSAPTVVCNSVVAPCGCQDNGLNTSVRSSRIINGQTAVANGWPWMVLLSLYNVKFCSGFLISPQHVITSALCLQGNGSNFTAYIGATSYNLKPAGSNVSNASSLDIFGDLAVITLGARLNYSSTVKPCCLVSDTTQPAVNDHAIIAGWGEQTRVLGTIPSSIQQATIQVRTPSTCGIQTDSRLFCGSFGSISACPIDAGGPVMTAERGLWTCVGLINQKTSCNSAITFTRIAPYYSFIQNITGILP